MTPEGVQVAVDFAAKHGDVLSVCFMGGIPWQEALDGRPFSNNAMDSFAVRPVKGSKLFLSISILDGGRTGLAPYWGEKDNLPLPAPWDQRSFNSPEVRRAYLQFVLRAVKAMNPDYLAVGMELNVLLSKAPAKWPQLKQLYRDTYAAVKAKYPSLPVFFTTEVIHYKKLTGDAKGSDQEREVADLMRQSDVFAMSVYPHMSYEVPKPVPTEFFDFAKLFRKPIAVAESGITSKNVVLKSYGITLYGSEADQTQFTDLLLKTAARDKYAFVITFATTDFEKLCDRLQPPTDDLARIWSFTGMQTSSLAPKPALAVWDAYLRVARK